jgi:LysM repeat protein
MRRRRSPARWLVPIALVACAVAVYAVVNATLLTDDDQGATAPASQSSTGTTRTTGKGKTSTSRGKRRRRYTVKAGDTLSSISAKTGVSLERIQDLNPELDSQALQTGERIKLSP